MATFSGTLPYMGYRTIVVPSGSLVRVNTGDMFSVVLTLTNPLNPDVAAVEMPGAGYCRDATSHPGETISRPITDGHSKILQPRSKTQTFV